MTSEGDYYEVLQSAISRSQLDSFEARGAVYDRFWQIVLEQLRSNPNTSEDDVAIERATFLRAVQRIEFGGGPPAPEPGVAQPDPRAPAADHDPAGSRQSKRATRARDGKPRRGMFRRVATAMVSAFVLLLVAGIAYALIAIRSDPTVVERWVDPNDTNSWQAQMMRVMVSMAALIERGPTTATTTTPTTTSPSNAQRAVLYEESASTATGTTFSGRAIWRHRAGSKSASSAALSINVEIPQRDIFLEITMRRAPDGGAASHFVEFQFFGPNRSPTDAVENIMGILMKNDELARGIDLKGQIVKVQQGMFLMGLSGIEADVASNMMLLKERGWLDIPIVLKGGVRAILAIEKGTTGQNALSEALATWGSG